jgi:flagellar hook-associated protein 3 FlgL
VRITYSGQFRDSTTAIQTAAERLADYQRQVSSGLRVQKPSDDPAAMSSVISEQGRLAQTDNYTRAGDSANSRLTVVDSVMSDIVSKLTAAQSLAVSVAGSIATPEERAAAAQEMGAMKAALLDDFNMTFQGVYLFSGGKATTKPFTVGAGGVVSPYAGSSSEVSVDIGQGHSVTIGFDGSTITQGSAASDVFTVIDNLVADINAGNSAGIANGVAALNDAFQRATTAQSRVGAGLEMLATDKSRLSTVKLASQTHLSKLRDANMADAITGMQQANTAYQASLAAAATTSKTSLMDYL